jgi:hypothetical protein
MLGHDEDAPDATDEERTWREVLVAATLQGAPPDRNSTRLMRIKRREGRYDTDTGPPASGPVPVRRTLTAMSDQHAAAALTAAAVIAAILVARAAILHQGDRTPRARTAHLPRRRSTPHADRYKPPSPPAAFSDHASSAVREAEQHVRHCWQQLPSRVDPPE